MLGPLGAACERGGPSNPPSDPIIGPALVFDDVHVFDGADDLGTTDVVVRDGVITSIGHVELAGAGPEVEVIDGRGKTLLPGLIDGHVHVSSISQLDQAAAFGVTTVLDMFMDEITMRAIVRQQAKGKLPDAAELRSSGTLATAPGGHGTEYGVEIPTVASPDEAAAWVAERVERGVNYIKIVDDDGHAAAVEFGNLDLATIEALIAGAHAHERLAVVHVSDLAAAKRSLRAGADGLAHVWFDAPADDEVLALLAERHAFVIATAVVMQTACADPRVREVAADARLAALIDPRELGGLLEMLDANAGARPCTHALTTIGQLDAAGIDLIAGTDIPNFGLPIGLAMHVELSLLVDAGLSPIAALRAATRTPADRFRMLDRGRIEPGARADLILVEGDPLRDIAATRELVGVWKAGAAIDLATRRQEIAKAIAAAEARRSAPPPPGSESGLVSDFEVDLSTAYGLAWEPATDEVAGGTSSVELSRVAGGMLGSEGALLIRGEVAAGTRAWAGANFFPSVERATVNLSSKRWLRFGARGTPGTHAVLLFGSSPMPTMASFELADAREWTLVEIDLEAIRAPSSELTFVFIGATTPGPFELRIDDVRIE
ncbi:amidohydrolase [Enhygromyxa salina]|uniref:Amidohydrolase n=1 Tax=Enhygromyxa salina TaxID=215803 RepID=A0A0C2D8N8_9BACT|nr:amidohydrolase [Enhygromyxa salina]